jgi:predicted secreted hydrolase
VNRRSFLLVPLALAGARSTVSGAQVRYPAASSTVLEFPRDHGSHAAFRTEWWYITAWVHDVDGQGDGQDRGVQITFFRNRPGVAESGTSRFAPRQLLFAHAAIADPRRGRLWHDQRAARAGLGLADALVDTTDVHISDWSLRLTADTYKARIAARDFALDLAFVAHGPPLLQGTQGLSRKGPHAKQASLYYSRPHLDVTGAITVNGRAATVRGTAWLDHEWSSEYLAPEARGWDWAGLNFDDGSALMAFRIRDSTGSAYWSGGALQDPRGLVRNFPPAEVRFTPLRRWRSPRTGTEYPVAFNVVAGDVDVTLEPLLDDQELDSRLSVGTVYWEGAVRAFAGARDIGRGYLELTGYGSALKL